jgi:hypothetical protein
LLRRQSALFFLIWPKNSYFRKDEMFGLAAYENIRTDSLQERNVRMKSVGILTKSFAHMKAYEKFLRLQVRSGFEIEKQNNYIYKLLYLCK